MKKGRILSYMIKHMSPRELYAFVAATVMEISRQSKIPTDDILSAVKGLVDIMGKEN